MRALEHWIACEVLGSKNRVRDEGLFSVKELSNIQDYKQLLENVCDQAHCNTLTFLKKQGDMTAHRVATKDQLKQAINKSSDTPAQRKLALNLVDMLDKFCVHDGKPFGWDLLVTETQNMCRLQLPMTASTSSAQDTGTGLLPDTWLAPC